jgi:Tol biopolymer transport system component
VIGKTFRLMMCILFLIAILVACAKPTEIVTLPPPPTDTQVPMTKTPLQSTATQVLATNTLPPPTATPAMPTQTLQLSPTTSSINEMPMTERVSVASNGMQGNSDSGALAISADGRYIVISSNASNLVESDTNGVADIFVHDRLTGQIQLVSIASDGTQGNSNTGIGSSISTDGRFVTFISSADNLVEGDTNGVQDCFVHDRVTGKTTRVSVASDGTQANGACAYFGLFGIDVQPSISADGRYVAFHSEATNLVEGDTNGVTDIFVHDGVTGMTTLVSVSSDGTQGNGGSLFPAISADGRYVVFQSDATNLVEGITHGGIFVYDRVTGDTTLEDISINGTEGNQGGGYPAISADGRYVSFTSNATNLVEGGTDGYFMNIFVHDRVTGDTTLVSVASDGTQANSGSLSSTISADGRYIAFDTDASNLVKGDTNGWADCFVYDRVTGDTTLVSVASDGTQGNSDSRCSSISDDERFVAFSSGADNLVEGDTNEAIDTFVRDLGVGK